MDVRVVLLCLATVGFWVVEGAAVQDGSPTVDDPIDWWRKTVFYQIYPRSFKDSDGDGIGDLRGITQNLEHFVEAGIGAIWLSPIFKSPMVDFGYDISDFREVHHEYGTMEDLENLIAKAKTLDLKVVLDFVPNHCSNESDYFKLSVNRTAGYEDFLVWDDGLIDPETNTRKPPSNWVSQFQGSAWQWNEQRQQYYLRQFSEQQPDLNYRNPAVVQEMNSVLTFWLDKGVDGFRVDALPYLMEADKNLHGGRYPDDPLTYAPGLGPLDLGYTTPIYSKDQDDTYAIVYQWRALLDAYSKKDGVTRVMLTEGYANLTQTMKYFGNATHIGSHIPFNFDFITELNSQSNAKDLVYKATRWLTYVPTGKYPNWVFGNHDNPRMASRFGSRMVDGLNMLDMILPGVAITYQGDEIGMENGYVSWKDTVDVSGCNAGEDKYEIFSRDPARTPFQWDNTTNAGFSNASKTWLPVGLDYKTLNLAKQKESSTSHFKVYQALTSLRASLTLQEGGWNLRAISDDVFVLTRTLLKHDTIGMVMNMGVVDNVADLSSFDELPDNLNVFVASINSSKKPDDVLNKSSISLGPGEAIVFTAPSKPC